MTDEVNETQSPETAVAQTIATGGDGPAPAKITRPDADPLVGTTIIDQFRVEARLGAGGMGVVYLAQQLGTDRKVAIKVLRPEVVDDHLQKRFLREGRVLSRLQHPNVVTVYNVGALPSGALFLAMEFVDGVELSSVLAEARATTDPDGAVVSRGGLALPRVVRIGEQLCRALVAAHHHGIVHRDLKPENVMITQRPGEEPDLVKVLDFGIARDTGDENATKLTDTGMVIGTPQFMSPEQCAGDALEPASDMYNVGLILYYALSGKLAISGRTPVECLVAHTTRVPEHLETVVGDGLVPGPLSGAVMRCLSKTASERPTAQEMAEIFAGLRTRAPETVPYAHRDPALAVTPESITRKSEAATRVDDAVTAPTMLAPDDHVAPTMLDTRPPEAPTKKKPIAAMAIGVVVLVGAVVAFMVGGGRAVPEPPAPPAISSRGEQQKPAKANDPAPSPAKPDNAPPAPEGMSSIPAGNVVWGGTKHAVGYFAIDVTEVSWVQYEKCQQAGKCTSPRVKAKDKSLLLRPVVGVTHADAVAYCAWRNARLPSVLEWTRAARGDTQRAWPARGGLPNLEGDEDGHEEAAPTDRFPEDRSTFDIWDMTGNVSEWVEPSPGITVGEPGQDLTMGSSFALGADEANIESPIAYPKGSWFKFVGFRCARSP